MYYLDSSVIVKRYIRETGTDWIKLLYDNKFARLYTVRISSVEVMSAFFIRLREKTLSRTAISRSATQFLRDWETRFQIIEVTPLLAQSAVKLVQEHPLRGYDAVQLASAVELFSVRSQLKLTPPIFVSADKRLLKVAANLGFPVENPNDHPVTDDAGTPPAH